VVDASASRRANAAKSASLIFPTNPLGPIPNVQPYSARHPDPPPGKALQCLKARSACWPSQMSAKFLDFGTVQILRRCWRSEEPFLMARVSSQTKPCLGDAVTRQLLTFISHKASLTGRFQLQVANWWVTPCQRVYSHPSPPTQGRIFPPSLPAEYEMLVPYCGRCAGWDKPKGLAAFLSLWRFRRLAGCWRIREGCPHTSETFNADKQVLSNGWWAMYRGRRSR